MVIYYFRRAIASLSKFIKAVFSLPVFFKTSGLDGVTAR